MFCRNCGKENKEEAKFCAFCGAPLEQPNKTPETEMPAAGPSGPEAQNGDGEVPGPEGSMPEKEKPGKKRRRRIWIPILAVCVVAAAAAAAVIIGFFITKDTRQYNRYMSDAERYMEEMDYEKAEAEYLSAIEIDPKQEEPYIQLADLYIATEEPAKAKEIIRRGIENIGEPEPDEEGSGGREEEKSGDEGVSIWDKQKEIEHYAEYEWITEPEIEADDIYYVKSNDYEGNPLNTLNLQFESETAVIRNGSSLSLIGMDGERITDQNFSSIYEEGKWYVLTPEEPVYEEEIGEVCQTYISDGRDIVPSFDGVSGGALTDAYYYSQGALHSIWEGTDFSYLQQDASGQTFPVQQSEEICSIPSSTGQFGERITWWSSLSGKYAVFTNGTAVTDFIYDRCGSESDGLLAVESDGKIGYVNTEGEEVIPLEYDPSWDQFYTYRQDETPFAYAASEGYVPLVSDGAWELRDVEGNVVIPSGIFEKILPVYDGKCWVKKDGRWGVISLGTSGAGEEAAEEENQEDDSLQETALLGQLQTAVGMDPQTYYFGDFNGDGEEEIFAVYQYSSGMLENDNCQIWYCGNDGARQLFLWENDTGNAFCNVMNTAEYDSPDGRQYFIVNTYQRVAMSYNQLMVFGPDAGGEFAQIFDVQGIAEVNGDELTVTEETVEITDNGPQNYTDTYTAEITNGSLQRK